MMPLARWALFLGLLAVPAWAAWNGLQYSDFGRYLALLAGTAVAALLAMRMTGVPDDADATEDQQDMQKDDA